jgi:hypothetical protein
MPLLEINQVRHICASVRLDEETAPRSPVQCGKKVAAGTEATSSVWAVKA